jgi:pimeloyl-ACP methyl ester carboxylesterase
MESREYRFDTGAVILNYAEVPSPGTPLVLLHGGNARWQAFETIPPDLSGAWHVYAPDFRGQGKSGWVPGTYRLQDYTDDTIALLRHHIDEPAYLFGHSLGGIVALLVAAQYPEGVRAVAVGDAHRDSQPGWDGQDMGCLDRERVGDIERSQRYGGFGYFQFGWKTGGHRQHGRNCKNLGCFNRDQFADLTGGCAGRIYRRSRV